jgi:hypothetical protein
VTSTIDRPFDFKAEVRAPTATAPRRNARDAFEPSETNGIDTVTRRDLPVLSLRRSRDHNHCNRQCHC